ncbi:hypothetical protein [Lysobacter firmicutimachus]|uniref:Uncharacterized protein n=1 Tax=Lysobacter firmicutimachus TaxID=1792846 RepID=A0ABU8D8D1_9GAMM
MSFSGRPDWRNPMNVGERIAFAAYDRPGAFLLPPTELVACGADAEPPLRLDLFQQDRGRAGLERFSILSLGFAAEFGLEAARQAAFDAGQSFALSALPADGGWLRLDAVEALDLPPALGELLPLDVASLGALGLALRLDSAASDLFVAALQRGLLSVSANAWLRVRGVADRLPSTLEFDPAALLSAVRQLGQGQLALDRDLLRERLIEAPQSLGFPAQAPTDGWTPQRLADALLDRIAVRFAALAPTPAEVEPGVRLAFDPAAMPAGRVRWDLAEPMLAPRLFAIQADPLGPLRTMPAAMHDAVVRRHDVRALSSGWRALTVRPNMPERRVGLAQAQVEVKLPARLPSRPFTIKASAPLDASDRPVRLDLRLSPSEALSYSWQTSAVLLHEGRAEIFKGPLQQSDREHLLIAPEDFGLRLIPVEAEPAFLEQADIDLECAGLRRGKPWSSRGRLDRDAPTLAFAIPPDLEQAAIRGLARARADGRCCALAPVEAEALRLDAFSFEGAGVRELRVDADFDDDAPQLLIELAPEDRIGDPKRRRSLRLSRNAAQADWHWLALSPFRSGYRWRWSPQSPWSPVLQPDTPLRLRSSQIPRTTAGAGA